MVTQLALSYSALFWGFLLEKMTFFSLFKEPPHFTEEKSFFPTEIDFDSQLLQNICETNEFEHQKTFW